MRCELRYFNIGLAGNCAALQASKRYRATCKRGIPKIGRGRTGFTVRRTGKLLGKLSSMSGLGVARPIAPISEPLAHATAVPVRVALVEDDASTRARFAHAIAAAPGLELAFTCSTGAEMLRWLQTNAPDALLVDLGLPDLPGIAVIASCASLYPACDIMVVSMFGDETHVLQSIEAGAAGYILKDSMTDEIGALVQELKAGGAPMSPLIARRVMQRFRTLSRSEAAAGRLGSNPVSPVVTVEGAQNPLTEREREVLERVARGFSYNEIGDLMQLSPHTVQTHIKRIYRKLAVHSKNEAVYEARRMGWIAQ